MIIDDATRPYQDSFPDLVSAMNLSPMAMIPDQFLLISLPQLELMKSMLGAEECFDDR